jgi:hypothetical protein
VPVEVAERNGSVLLRDSGHPGPALEISHADWALFLAAAKDGRYDQLSPSFFSASLGRRGGRAP